MGEGKTNMFGKTYNTIGSTDSNFIIKTKGDLKVQWGNKYIDIIKNGKIASEGSKLLFIVDSVEEITKNGIYLVNTEPQEIWLNIDGTKVNIIGAEGQTAYISYMVDQKLTSEQQHLALTNIGFYYNNIEDAALANIASGIIYVEDINKLYIAKQGKLTEYVITTTATNTESSEISIKKEPLYIEEYSLWVGETEYIKCYSSEIKMLMPVTMHDMLQSESATDQFGYRLYMDNNKSIFEIDIIKQREYPEYITYNKLETLIIDKQLQSKKYYLITDFQNPWEVTWEDEPFYYEDQYEEINSIKHLKGKRNATKLIIRALNSDTIEKQVWAPMYPDWVIHYDPFFKGPEHKVIEEGKEVIYYGFRTRDFEQTLEDGSIKKTTTYLPCKGQITYLKDEFGNEGNFNFRQHMFKHVDCWRYCVDKYPSGPTNYFGEFLECYNNVFNFEQLETNVQVFNFKEVLDSSNNVTGYTIEAIDSDKILTKGHHLYINGTTINNNVFNLDNYQKDIILQHTITSDILENNSFIKIKKPINCSQNLKSNYFENIEGELNIQAACSNNTVVNIKSNVVIQEGTQFDKNKISNFNQWLDNTKIFIENTINECSGSLTNRGTMSQNNITTITNIVNTNVISDNIFITVDNINNTGFIQENMIDYIKSLENSGTFTSNVINNINATLINKETIHNNTIGDIATDLVNNNYTIQDNTITYINTLTINSNIQNNTITNLINTTVNSDISNNIATTITDCQFNDFCTDNIFRGTVSKCKFGVFTDNKAYKELNDCIFTAGNINSSIFIKTVNKLTVSDTMQGCTFNYINNLVLDKPVYYTTFHGNIGNISRELTDYEWELLADPSKKTDTYPNIRVVCVPEIIKKGMILMWYGKEEIPKGWALCDGRNGTPNLVGSFIKGDSSTASGPTVPEGVNEETNEFTLKTDHIPKHSHPHKAHYHYFEGTGSDTIIDDYAYEGSSYYVNSGEGTSTKSGETLYQTSQQESISITISGNTSSVTSKEGEWQYNDPPTPIKLEPKHFKIIFIMKIDENPE